MASSTTALNEDFVVLDHDPDLSTGEGPYENLIIEGDNFDALRALRSAYSGQVKCIYIDPPYNTGNKDFVYNDRFIDKDHAWRHRLSRLPDQERHRAQGIRQGPHAPLA